MTYQPFLPLFSILRPRTKLESQASEGPVDSISALLAGAPGYMLRAGPGPMGVHIRGGHLTLVPSCKIIAEGIARMLYFPFI